MFSKFFKTLFKTGKTAKKTVEDSVDFIDDVLEKEYITSTIEQAKEATGDMVEKAGTIYQKTKDKIEENFDTERLKDKLESAKETGKKMMGELSDTMSESSETLKNVMNEGKEMLDNFFEEE